MRSAAWHWPWHGGLRAPKPNVAGSAFSKSSRGLSHVTGKSTDSISLSIFMFFFKFPTLRSLHADFSSLLVDKFFLHAFAVRGCPGEVWIHVPRCSSSWQSSSTGSWNFANISSPPRDLADWWYFNPLVGLKMSARWFLSIRPVRRTNWKSTRSLYICLILCSSDQARKQSGSMSRPAFRLRCFCG